MADADLLLEWRNDPVVREQSFTQDVIRLDQHIAWLARRIGSCQFQIAEVDGVPVGQVRVDNGEVSYSVAAEFRNRGYGTQMILAIMTQPLSASVKYSNPASCRVFERLGWAIVSAADGAITFRHTP